MRVLEPGHYYELDCLGPTPDSPTDTTETLTFVKRVGRNYPGNDDPAWDGTTTQEVLRALIDRTEYVDNQREDLLNKSVLRHFRLALLDLEQRAALQRSDLKAHREIGEMLTGIYAGHDVRPEKYRTCPVCGHILCHRHKVE